MRMQHECKSTRMVGKQQNHTEASSQKIINYDTITLTLHHSFNKRAKYRFAPTTKADSGGFEPTT